MGTKTTELTTKEASRYLEFYLSRTVNELLLGTFKFLTYKKYDIKTIMTYKPDTISIHNYQPLTYIYKHPDTAELLYTRGRNKVYNTNCGQLNHVSLYQFNRILLDEIEHLLMHELTHVHQSRTTTLEQNPAVPMVQEGYDNYRNNHREKEANYTASEFIKWCRDNHFKVGNIRMTRLLLNAFPQGYWLFGVKKEGVKMVGFYPRDLSNFKEIL